MTEQEKQRIRNMVAEVARKRRSPSSPKAALPTFDRHQIATLRHLQAQGFRVCGGSREFMNAQRQRFRGAVFISPRDRR